MKPISAESLDAFDQAHQKFREFAEREFKDMNYYIIVSFSKTKGTEIESFGGTLANLSGITPWAIVKCQWESL